MFTDARAPIPQGRPWPRWRIEPARCDLLTRLAAGLTAHATQIRPIRTATQEPTTRDRPGHRSTKLLILNHPSGYDIRNGSFDQRRKSAAADAERSPPSVSALFARGYRRERGREISKESPRRPLAQRWRGWRGWRRVRAGDVVRCNTASTCAPPGGFVELPGHSPPGAPMPLDLRL